MPQSVVDFRLRRSRKMGPHFFYAVYIGNPYSLVINREIHSLPKRRRQPLHFSPAPPFRDGVFHPRVLQQLQQEASRANCCCAKARGMHTRPGKRGNHWSNEAITSSPFCNYILQKKKTIRYFIIQLCLEVQGPFRYVINTLTIVLLTDREVIWFVPEVRVQLIRAEKG